MSAPSFAQLFRQSRYSRFGPPGNGDQEQESRENERKEDFAVAAVGFLLKHDSQFRKKFLKKFAGIEDDGEDFEPSIQAADCTDLKLENPRTRTLVVVEFKVRAELQPKQNPWPKRRGRDDVGLTFWSKRDNGYGYQLGQENYDQFSTIYYIVVQQNERHLHEDACERYGKIFRLKSRSWNTLLDPQSGLEEDLVESLGQLGIEELEDWRMRDIRVKDEDLEAFFKGQDAMKLLLRISKKLGIKTDSASKELVNYYTDSSGGVYRQLGIGVPNEALKKLGGIRAKCLKWTWLGYLSENKQQFKAQVWFYGNKGAKPKLRTLVNAELGNCGRIKDNPDDIEHGLRLLRSEDSSLGDFDWFCKVLGIEKSFQ